MAFVVGVETVYGTDCVLLPSCKRALLAAKPEGTAPYGSCHSTAPENSLKSYTSHCQWMATMYPASVPDILVTPRLVMPERKMCSVHAL